MRHCKLFLSLLMSLITFTACGSDDDDNAGGGASQATGITVDPTRISAPTEGGTYTIAVKAGGREWKAYSTDSWITVTTSGTTSSAGSATVTVAANTANDQRHGSVVVASGTQRVSVSVTQAGVTPVDPEPIDEGAVDPNDITTPAGYNLVWHDEFTGNRLGSDWKHEVQNAGWVINELQAYVNNDRVTNVANGVLNITCYKDNSGRICSGRIYARPQTGWTYGWFEARIKLPSGKGTWPAFWMMPVKLTNWPNDGENDIMEEVGYDPNNVHSTIHCNGYNNGGTAKESGTKHVDNAEGGWHVYACEWTEDYISYYVDGEKYFTYTPDDKTKRYWPFNQPFYIILNLAWGGQWGGQQGVDEKALPATMKVDYVRVFQK